MSEIDWEGLVEEVNDTPRARLVQALEDADAMTAVLIVYEVRGESHLETGLDYKAGVQAGGGSVVILGLAEWARHRLLKDWDEA